MRRRTVLAAAGALAATPAIQVFAQAPKSTPRVSFLSHGSAKSFGHLLDEFRASLRSLGYVEGRNLILDLWWAEDRLERLPALIAELMKTRPAVIVTHGSNNVAAVRKATSSVPIVFAAVGWPVQQGFIASYRRPGGNITGVAFNEEIWSKVYELVKVVMPGATRVARLVNPDNPASEYELQVLSSIVKPLRLESVVVHARSERELEGAFARAVAEKAQALVLSAHAPFIGLRGLVTELQFKHRLPTFHGFRESVAEGGLAGYSFPQEENYRRAAAIVDQILKGRNPAEIPVEIPTKYEILINLKTAQALGIKVPESALLRASTVIR